MYCCQLWFNSTKGSFKKLRTSYNSVLRVFLVISKPYSASQMFVSRGILSFDELLSKSIYRFVDGIENDTNSNILIYLFYKLNNQLHACLSSSDFYTLPFVNGGAHYCWHCTDMLVFVFFIHLSFILILHIVFICVLLQLSRFFTLYYIYIYIFGVRILCIWYRCQQLCIQWGKTKSSFLTISNSVRQSGLLSPKLFLSTWMTYLIC